MSIVAIVDRDSKCFSDAELLQIFADCKRKHGDDIGLMIVGLHLENLARIEDMEHRLAKLEAKRK
jgi:hypothetical protein